MDQDVRDLATAPFQDIVDKGNTAVENATAGENEQMLKSAKALVREGERALKKLEPVCKKHLEEYSSNFIDALKANDDIAQFRTDLNELLWEFEDYVEVDEFDAEKFTELQALSRKAAPRIHDILVRMRLEAPPVPSPIPTPSEMPFSALTPPLSQVSSNPLDEYARSIVTETASYRDSMSPSVNSQNRPSVVDSIVNLKTMMTAESGPDLGLDGGKAAREGHVEPLKLLSRTDSSAQRPGMDGTIQRRENEQEQGQQSQPQQPPPPPPAVPEKVEVASVPEEAPPEPDANPWHMEVRPSVSDVLEGLNRMGSLEGENEVERRERMPALADSPTLPLKNVARTQTLTQETSSLLHAGVSYTMRPRESEETLTMTEEPSPWTQVASPVASSSAPRVPVPPMKDIPIHRAASTGHYTAPRTLHSHPSLPSNMIPIPQQQPTIQPRESSYSWTQGWTMSQSNQQYNSPTTASFSNSDDQGGRISFASSGQDSQSPHQSPIHPSGSQHPIFRTPSYDPVSPDASSWRSSLSPGNPPIHPAFYSAKRAGPNGLVIPEESEPLLSSDYPEVVHDEVEDMPQIDSGLIPVNVEHNHIDQPIVPVRPQLDCSIGPRSSFHILKGFCESAKEYQRSGNGAKQTRKLVYDGGAVAAAKCKNCLYELEWRQVEADRAGSDTANYVSQGVGFRLRFLSKSHLPSNSVEDQVYGCLFCLQLGRTPEEGDATVFFSQKQLFSHLARHPRPLPVVPGITVIDAPQITPAFRNDYDLHFFSPPVPSQLIGIRRELSLLPTATATTTLKKVHGTIRRPPGDPHEPLTYAEGAKIIGVEFPVKFKGEWAVGWSDGRRSLFPMDTVRLDAPAQNEIRMQQTTSLRVTTRWKFAPGNADSADWLSFKKGETITNISWAYQTHWCWSGTNSKGKWGIFPHSHVDMSSLLDLATLPSADAASISSGETQHRSGAGRILSKISLRARGRPPSTISSSSHETQPAGGSSGGGAPVKDYEAASIERQATFNFGSGGTGG